MTELEDLTQDGVTRRRLLMRGAVAGGVVWAAPAITSIGGSAFAASPGEQDISFVAILYRCGSTVFRTKWEVGAGGTLTQECGTSFQVDGCSDQLSGQANSQLCGPATATFNASTGNLSVNLGTCTLVDFVVKCGDPSDPADQGCQDTNQVQQPNVGDTGTVVFVPCVIP
jgi:hypothetical protein